MRGEHQPSALWDSGGSRGRAELDQGKGKKTDTNSGNPKPQQEGMADGRSLGRESSISPRHLSRSPRRYICHITTVDGINVKGEFLF